MASLLQRHELCLTGPSLSTTACRSPWGRPSRQSQNPPPSCSSPAASPWWPHGDPENQSCRFLSITFYGVSHSLSRHSNRLIETSHRTVPPVLMYSRACVALSGPSPYTRPALADSGHDFVSAI